MHDYILYILYYHHYTKVARATEMVMIASLFLCLLGLFSVSAFARLAPLDSRRNRIVCPRDVRKCSDGTYVTRTRPSCEFRPCPAGAKLVTLQRISVPTKNDTKTLETATSVEDETGTAGSPEAEFF